MSMNDNEFVFDKITYKEVIQHDHGDEEHAHTHEHNHDHEEKAKKGGHDHHGEEEEDFILDEKDEKNMIDLLASKKLKFVREDTRHTFKQE